MGKYCVRIVQRYESVRKYGIGEFRLRWNNVIKHPNTEWNVSTCPIQQRQGLLRKMVRYRCRSIFEGFGRILVKRSEETNEDGIVQAISVSDGLGIDEMRAFQLECQRSHIAS